MERLGVFSLEFLFIAREGRAVGSSYTEYTDRVGSVEVAEAACGTTGNHSHTKLEHRVVNSGARVGLRSKRTSESTGRPVLSGTPPPTRPGFPLAPQRVRIPISSGSESSPIAFSGGT